jgi:DNA repair exonuclease SbcCD nuclease subunit
VAFYLLVNDIHLADRPPASCTDAYQEDLFALLGQVRVLAQMRKAAAIVLAGDVFHHKAPSRTSHRLVLRLQVWAQSCPCDVLVVPGNHDMQFDRMESLHLTQPLGVLLSSPNVQLLESWAAGHPVYGVPWVQGYGDSGEDGEAGTQVDGRLAAWRSEISGRQPSLVVAHAPLYPPGQELPYEYFPAERWAAAMDGQGSCWYGHVHERHGVFMAGEVTFANFGALSRGSLHEYNLTRKVAVGGWDSYTGLFEEILLAAKPPSEVFRFRSEDRPADMHGRLDAFLEQAGTTQLDVLSPASVFAAVRAMGLGKDAEALIEELLS